MRDPLGLQCEGVRNALHNVMNTGQILVAMRQYRRSSDAVGTIERGRRTFPLGRLLRGHAIASGRPAAQFGVRLGTHNVRPELDDNTGDQGGHVLAAISLGFDPSQVSERVDVIGPRYGPIQESLIDGLLRGSRLATNWDRKGVLRESTSS